MIVCSICHKQIKHRQSKKIGVHRKCLDSIRRECELIINETALKERSRKITEYIVKKLSTVDLT